MYQKVYRYSFEYITFTLVKDTINNVCNTIVRITDITTTPSNFDYVKWQRKVFFFTDIPQFTLRL